MVQGLLRMLAAWGASHDDAAEAGRRTEEEAVRQKVQDRSLRRHAEEVVGPTRVGQDHEDRDRRAQEVVVRIGRLVGRRTVQRALKRCQLEVEAGCMTELARRYCYTKVRRKATETSTRFLRSRYVLSASP